MKLHFYKAFGLNISSDFVLPALPESGSSSVDVRIHHAPISDHLEADWSDETTRYKNWEAGPGRFLMRVNDVADYLVKDGNEICIERQNGVEDDAVIAYLMGSAMAAMLHQRKLLTLHGSAIQVDGGAILFVGQSGAGKSTLLSRLLKSGHAMLTDDVAAISLENPDQPVLMPAFPTTRLWKDTLDKLELEDKAKQKVRAELDKFLVTADNFCLSPQPIKMIFVLGSHNREEIEIEPVEPGHRFSHLDEHSFRKGYMKGHGLQRHHFESISNLAKTVPMVSVTRPAHLFLLDELEAAVMQHLSNADSNR